METKYTYDNEGRIILKLEIDGFDNPIKETRYKYEEKNEYKYVYKRVISKYNIKDSYFQIYKYDDNRELVSCMIKDVYNRKVYEFKNSTIIINDYYDNSIITAILSNDKILKLTKYRIVDNKQYNLITFNSEKNGEFKFIDYDKFNRIKSIHIFYKCDYLMGINKTILENPINYINNIFLLIAGTNPIKYYFIKILYTYEKNTNKIKTKKICTQKNDCNTVFEYNNGNIISFKSKCNNTLLIGTIDININNTNSIYEINTLECDISIIESVESYNLHLVYENDILVEVYDNNVKNKNEYNNKLNTLLTIPEIQYFSNIINSLDYCDNYIIPEVELMDSFISKEYDNYSKAKKDYISFTKDNYTFKSSGNVLNIYITSINDNIKTIEVFKVLFDIRNFDVINFNNNSIESYIENTKEDIISNYILEYKLLPNNKEILINREEIK